MRLGREAFDRKSIDGGYLDAVGHILPGPGLFLINAYLYQAGIILSWYGIFDLLAAGGK